MNDPAPAPPLARTFGSPGRIALLAAAVIGVQAAAYLLARPLLQAAAADAAAAGALLDAAAVLATVGALVRPGVAALAAWAILLLLGRPVRLAVALGIFLAGQLIMGGQDLFHLALQRLAGDGGGPLTAPAGLDVLLPGLSSPLAAAAAVLTPFRLAWTGFVAWALRAASRGRWYHGAVPALMLLAVAMLLATLRPPMP